jgi:HTH-type transcriptional regulator, sugar sensing transcriptional regulator
MHPSLIESLLTIGLSNKQARVYLALLELGSSSAYPIAKKSGLKTPTAYVILSELLEKNVVQSVPRTKKKLFTPTDPRVLFSNAEVTFTNAQKSLPALISLISEPSRAPLVRSFSGKNQLLQAYHDTLTAPHSTIRGWLSEGAWSEHGLEYFLHSYYF